MNGMSGAEEVMRLISYIHIKGKKRGFEVVISPRSICENLNFSNNYARSILRKLEEKELIIYDLGTDYKGYTRGYKPTEKGEKSKTYQEVLKEFEEKENAELSKPCECKIGQANDYDNEGMLMSLSDIKKENYTDEVLRTLVGNENTFTKFNYCPFCSKKIDWEEIKKQLLTNF